MQILPINKNLKVLLDDNDFLHIRQWKWEMTGDRVQRSAFYKGKRSTVSLARYLMNCPPGMEVDHINRDRLDNQRSNLRICTRSQNEINKPVRKCSKSGIKGVIFDRGKWRASIKKDGRRRHIGYFTDKRDAALAYNEKAKELFGEFAWLNPA